MPLAIPRTPDLTTSTTSANLHKVEIKLSVSADDPTYSKVKISALTSITLALKISAKDLTSSRTCDLEY